MDAAHAAINAGADAIYIGGGFSARAYAENFKDEDILAIIEYAHIMHKKVYAAVNIMIFDDEMEAALSHVDFLYNAGVDAVIMADIGLIAESRRRFVDLPIHISTQMGVHDKNGALLMRNLGAQRVVPAREATLKDLRGIADTGIEVEAFCHGALCSGYSGACLMSSMIGGRSGNRGKCAQPCRLKYTLNGKKGYFLSTADLCTINMLDKLEKAGVTSLKIEGRMKRAEYVAGVTEEYRLAIDKSNDPAAKDRLKQIFNRGGFTEGYFTGSTDVTYTKRPDHIGVKIGRVERLINKGKAVISTNAAVEKLDALSFGEDAACSIIIGYADACNGGYMIPVPRGVKKGDAVYRTASESQLAHQRDIIKKDGKLKAEAQAYISSLCDGYLTINSRGVFSTVVIPKCEQARGEVNRERLLSAIKKTVGFGVEIEKADLTLEGVPFISISELNKIRRDCVELLKKDILTGTRGYLPNYGEKRILQNRKEQSALEIAVSVRTSGQAKAAFSAGADRVYVYADKSTNHEEFLGLDGECHVVLPPFSTEADLEKLENIKHIYKGVICSGWGEFAAAKRIFSDVHCDFLMNIANSYAQEQALELGAKGCTASVEANLKQLSMLKYPFEAVVYGHIPIISMRHCPLKKEGHCKECDTEFITDRKGYKMRFLRTGLAQCQCVLLNPVLTAVENIDELKEAGAGALRLMFFYEDEKEVYNITKMYKAALSGGIINIAEEHNSAHIFRGV